MTICLAEYGYDFPRDSRGAKEPVGNQVCKCTYCDKTDQCFLIEDLDYKFKDMAQKAKRKLN
jgi:hypothetical protein